MNPKDLHESVSLFLCSRTVAAQPRDISLTVMLEWLANDDEVAVLRSDARYEVLVDRLKRVSKKP